MSDSVDKMVKSVIDAIDTRAKKKPRSYYTQAEVLRVDNGTVYVHIPGGVDETPVKETIDCKAGDVIQVRVGDGSAVIVGNQSAPPTDDTTAISAKQTATVAEIKAKEATEYAATAKDAADSAQISAAAAATSAQEAKQSAYNANEYASRALGGLSTVQSVVETLTWITQHGTMTLTSDVALDPTHVYFVQDAAGSYTVNGVNYAIVVEPDVADIATYYELSIDESLNNYVATHLALTQEGLWLLPATSGTNKVLIATGAGSTYTVAGTYLIDSSGNIVASFRADGATMSSSGVEIAHFGYGSGVDSGGGTSTAPYYTVGQRKSGTVIGNYSIAEGYDTTANNFASHAEGYDTTASGLESHAEGYDTTASGDRSHAEGNHTTASDLYSHAEGTNTKASGERSHAECSYTTASGDRSHAEGHSTTASGTASHTEGTSTTASKDESHAEGYGTVASGSASHAEGYETVASGSDSHAGGYNTIADQNQQTAIGKYNTSGNTNNLFVVGNGTSNARSDAFTVSNTGGIGIALDNAEALYTAINNLGWTSDVID